MTDPVAIDESTLRRIVAESVAPLQAELAAIRASLRPPTPPLISPIEFAKVLGMDVGTLHLMELAGDVAPEIRPEDRPLAARGAETFRRNGCVESPPTPLSIRRRRGSL